jgi:hypothetical protein
LWFIFAVLDVDPIRIRNTAFVDICAELLATLLYLYDPSWRLFRLLPFPTLCSEPLKRYSETDICAELLATLLYLYDPSWRLPGVRLLPGQKSLADNTSSRTLTPAQIKSIKRCASFRPTESYRAGYYAYECA